MSSADVQVNQLAFSYGREALFSSLDVGLQRGSMYGLLGKNGAGKTTLLKLIAGLLFPQDGSINVFGEDPTNRTPGLLADIFFLPEEFYLPALSVREYVSVYAPFYPKFDHEMLDRQLKEFDIRIEKKLNALSYGQKKKFLIAFGLASRASLCLLDEPTNGLDIPSKSQFRKVVASSLNEDRIFIISTHQVRDMEFLIDPVIIIDEGKIIFQESYDDIVSRLTIKHVRSLPEDAQVIYSQEEINGYKIVTSQDGSEETTIDLETLFNAVLSDPIRMAEVFSREVVR